MNFLIVVFLAVIGYRVSLVESSCFFAWKSNKNLNFQENALLEAVGKVEETIRINLERERTKKQTNGESKIPGSILKHPSEQKKQKRSVKFIVDEKSEAPVKARIGKNIQEAIRFAYEEKGFVKLITPESELYDYEIDSEDSYNWKKFKLPWEFSEMIELIFPGLENVKIAKNDLAALVYFSAYHCHDHEDGDGDCKCLSDLKFLRLYSLFMETFPECEPVVQMLCKEMVDGEVPKFEAMQNLFIEAFKNNYFYTIEAFYRLMGIQYIEGFITNAIKFNSDLKLIKRLLSEYPVAAETIVANALKYNNIPVYAEYSRCIESFEQVAKVLNSPVVKFVAKGPNYFPGLVDYFAEAEGENHFNDALSLCISSGNFKMFKDLLNHDNSLFKDFSPTVLDALRSIITGQRASLKLSDFESQEVFEDLLTKILLMGNVDQNLTEAFRTAIPDLIKCGFWESAIFISVFLDDQEFIKMILNCPGHHVKLVLKYEDEEGNIGSYGYWELLFKVKDRQQKLIQVLSESPSFNIFYAIANSEFPDTLWPHVIEEYIGNEGQVLITEQSYENLATDYAFINTSSLEELGFKDKTSWSLLDLAILNFNQTGVKQLIAKFGTDIDIKSSLELANNYLELINTDGYMEKYIQPHIRGRISLYKYCQSSRPDLFDAKISLNGLITKIKTDLESIISLLEIYYIKPKLISDVI